MHMLANSAYSSQERYSFYLGYAKLGLRAVLAGVLICFAKFSPMTLYLRAFFFVVFFTCVFALVTLPPKPSSSIT